VPEEKRHIISEYLTRVKYSRMTGAVEMDFSDGELAYRNAIICGSSIPTDDNVKYVMQGTASALDEYGDGVIHILQDGMAPNQALEVVE
jgi:hypothetical protein